MECLDLKISAVTFCRYDGEPNLAVSFQLIICYGCKTAKSITVTRRLFFWRYIWGSLGDWDCHRNNPKTDETKMIVITASKDDQFASWDEDARHGLFTKHVIDGLSGAADSDDFQGNAWEGLGELKAYLDDEMS